MKTGEEINSRFFNDLENLLKSYKQAIQKNLVKQKIDLTFDQWQVFGLILSSNNLRQTEIAAKAGKDTASITRIVELLVKKELLKREVDGGNRRRTILMVTEAGERSFKKAGETINEITSKALQEMKPKRLKKIRKVFKAISKNCR